MAAIPLVCGFQYGGAQELPEGALTVPGRQLPRTSLYIQPQNYRMLGEH